MAQTMYGEPGGGGSLNLNNPKSNTSSASATIPTSRNMKSELLEELKSLEGLNHQHPETGARGSDQTSYISQYTNRLFGAPYQLLDSVDRRFESVNTHLGAEYLRNIILNSPILTIKPGMPKYTGNMDPTELSTQLKNAYLMTTGDENGGVGSFLGNMLKELATSKIFGTGSQLQRRMYGFRETYYDYMQHVNFMCRSTATFLNLTTGSKFPSYCFGSKDSKINFVNAKWENYRFLSDTVSLTPTQYLMELLSVPKDTIVAAATTIANVGNVVSGAGVINSLIDLAIGKDNGDEEFDLASFLGWNSEAVTNAWNAATENSFADQIVDKVSCVQFMVEPVSFSETLRNETQQSAVESITDGLMESIGYELKWIGDTKADIGEINRMIAALGNTASDAMLKVSGLMESVTGGFLSNVFSGAIRSIKGQKMIYPEIYKKSESTMNYEFEINLTSPYGDVYNYYMNIVVPLLHLIALAAPRMVTSNTLTSPFIVQAFIPGMCTCNLGIVENMQIQKNPSAKHVSVNGFPLSLKVTFTIKELYNALSISPANDPASFLYNETLNDYMANLAGMIPSMDMYREQRANALNDAGDYFFSGEWTNDVVAGWVENIENTFGAYH